MYSTLALNMYIEHVHVLCIPLNKFLNETLAHYMNTHVPIALVVVEIVHYLPISCQSIETLAIPVPCVLVLHFVSYMNMQTITILSELCQDCSCTHV